MTLNNVKRRLYERISAYWGGATVRWGSAAGVKPDAPLVVLRMGTLTRPTQPIAQFIKCHYITAYPTQTTLQVDLFTRGRLVNGGGDGGEEDGGYYENTAASDLLRFVNYLDSPGTVDWCEKNDISIHIMGGVRDLSEVINSTQWSYRAMVELKIGFTEWSAEFEGVLGNEEIEIDENGNIIKDGAIVFDADGNPIALDRDNWEETASGGGTKPLSKEIIGFFKEVEVTEVDKNGK